MPIFSTAAAGRGWPPNRCRTMSAAIDRHVRELDRLAEDLALLDREIAQDAIDDSAVNRLMTITGVNLAVAAGIMAAIGDISRFNSPQKLVSSAEPAGAAVRTGRRPSRPHQQDRPLSRARHAGRGGLGSGQGRVRCMRFSCASAPGAAIRSPRWPWPGS